MFDRVLRVIDHGGFVAIIGDRGTGKTQAAVEAVKHTVKKLKSALYAQAQEIIEQIHATYSGQTREQNAIDRFIRPHLLVVDEQQERRHTDDENRLLTYLLDRRYGAMRPTIILSNATEATFREQVGASVWDRISETGVVLKCLWPSFRNHDDEGGDGNAEETPAPPTPAVEAR